MLVTGAGGFVGSAVVRQLAERLRQRPLLIGGETRANHVVGVIRPGGDTTRLATVDTEACCSIRELDLADGAGIGALVAELQPVAIVHAALARNAYTHDTADFREVAVLGPLRELVSWLGRHGGRRIVHTGSSWVLSSGIDLGEESVPEPASPYARAKYLEDRTLPAVAEDSGIEWINLRLFNLFGRYEPARRLIPYIVTQLSRGEIAELSVAENVRDFTDVDLAAEAFVQALEASPAVANRLYHIGTGRGTRIGDVARLVAEMVGGADRLRFGQRRTADGAMSVQVADPALAGRHLGWNPPDDLRDRIGSVVRWWQNHMRSHQPSL